MSDKWRAWFAAGQRGRVASKVAVLTAALLCTGIAVGRGSPERGARNIQESSDSITSLGERLYSEGIDTAGRPVVAVDFSGNASTAPQFHCVSCHRPSGYGSGEGGVYIAPIAAPILFDSRSQERTRVFSSMFHQNQGPEFTNRLYKARTRPAYDDASIGRLLRTGIDSAGRPISTAMPRYRLSDRDISALTQWLRSLSASPSPGVTDKTLKFAVVLSDDIPDQTRKMVVATAQAYFNRVNKGIASDRSRPNFSPYYRSDFASFWREWQLVVWQLHGPRTSWPAQLKAQYAADPVFAVVSGAVSGSWEPVGSFCNNQHLPCLFPLTELPAPDTGHPGYTAYLSGGLPLEARVMASYLTRDSSVHRLVQLADGGTRGAIPATVLQTELRKGRRPIVVRTIRVGPGDSWASAVRRAQASSSGSAILAVWPGPRAMEAVNAIAAANPRVAKILLSSDGEAAAKSVFGPVLKDRVRIIHPTELPGQINPLSYRVRAWLNARKVATTPVEQQFLVYYALSVLEKSVEEIQGDFYRDYLMERVEMLAESNLNPGVYPTLSLGPGQRYASRGSYVVRLDSHAPGGIRADGDWIVP